MRSYKISFQTNNPLYNSVCVSLHDWIKLVTNHLKPFANPTLPILFSPPTRLLLLHLLPPSPLNRKPRHTLTQIITILKQKKEQRISGFIWTIMQIRQEMKLLLML